MIPNRLSTPTPPALDPLPLLTALTQAVRATHPGWVRPAGYFQLCNSLLTCTVVFTGQHTPVRLPLETLGDPDKCAALRLEADRQALLRHQSQIAAIQRNTAEPWNRDYPYPTARGPQWCGLLAACQHAVTAALAHLAGDPTDCQAALAALLAWSQDEVAS